MTSAVEDALEPKTGQRSRQAFDRLVALQTVTTELASALEQRCVAEVTVRSGVRTVGAVVAGVWLTRGDEARLVGSMGLSDEQRAATARLRLSDAAPLMDSIRLRKAVIAESVDEYVKRYPALAKRFPPCGGVPSALASLPMVVDGNVLGAIMFGWGATRAFDRDDLPYLEILVGHAALAFERARLFEEEHRARMRTEILYELASAMMRADSLDAIFEPALDAVCRALAVDRASILLFDDRRLHMRFCAWRGLSAAYRRAVEGHSPWQADAIDPTPILVGDVTREPTLARYRDVFEVECVGAIGFVPLCYEGKLLGKFVIYARQPRAFGTDDLRVAVTVATQLAQAIARRKAEEGIVRAKAAAEAAALQRESLLAMVAHDLRNPLGVAQLKSQVMMRQVPEGDLGQKLKRDLETIYRNTLHMGRLIDDLVDVAAIDSAHLSIERAPAGVKEIVNEALDLARPLAEKKRIRMTAGVASGLSEAQISCDRQRIMQVLSNLTGNAIKFAPDDSEVEIRAIEDDGGVRFSVADEGPGIPVEDRERVFEQWTCGKKKGGIGLGLFIARGLVHAHGGRIWIESNHDAAGRDRGALVAFTVPRERE
ncbi:MAG: GAF domain-containing protein [Labilithrix sp.]|nr:GAF domain-containing protein [Labilithrix sp.]